MVPPEESGRPSPRRRAIAREEGEVSQWPRGLAHYVPTGPEDSGPAPEEEDRTAQRLQLAARLIDLLRARGRDDTGWSGRLIAAERLYRRGQRPDATRAVDELIGLLGEEADLPEPSRRQP